MKSARIPGENGNRYDQGQAIPEYALIGALVLLITISALISLGGNLNSIFSNMLGKPQRMAAAAPTASINPLGPSGALVQPSTGQLSAQIPPPGPGQVQACFDNGSFCFNIPEVAAGTKPNTLGGNGSEMTRQYADMLSQVAEQYKQGDNVNEDFLGYLERMANLGHHGADWENAMDQFVQQNCTATGGSTVNGTGGCITSGDYSAFDNFLKEIDYVKGTLQGEKSGFSNWLNIDPSLLPPGVGEQCLIAIQNIINITGKFNEYAVYSAKYSGELACCGMDPAWTPTSGPITDMADGAPITETNANYICDQGGADCVHHNYTP